MRVCARVCVRACVCVRECVWVSEQPTLGLGEVCLCVRNVHVLRIPGALREWGAWPTISCWTAASQIALSVPHPASYTLHHEGYWATSTTRVQPLPHREKLKARMCQRVLALLVALLVVSRICSTIHQTKTVSVHVSGQCPCQCQCTTR